MNDIAVVSTIIEAAKFQKVRPRPDPPAPFPITRADLRSYRRAPTPEQSLTLLIDYTSLADVCGRVPFGRICGGLTLPVPA